MTDHPTWEPWRLTPRPPRHGRKPSDPRWKLRYKKHGGKDPNHPEPGYFRIRQVRRGPWLPALIWIPCPLVIPEPWEEYTEPPDYWCRPTDPYRGPRWVRAHIDGAEADPLVIWQRGEHIAARDYHFLMAQRDWTRRWEPWRGEATAPRNLDREPSLF